MTFPRNRPRRLRRTAEIRDLVREVRVEPRDLVLPLFTVTGRGVREPVPSMPGVERLSADQLAVEGKELRDLGIPAVILFGIPDRKDALGSGAYDPDGVVQTAVRALKDAVPELVVMADVCLCEYTDHGHCGVYDGEDVQNDPTLPLLARTSVSVARAGADIVAPSDMMDGRIGAVRDALDAEGLEQTPVLSYAAKYASAFYGPFRDAADSTPQQGDRRGYQMDPANVREALREIETDLAEGADMVMVKPALPYLDVLRAARECVDVPLFAYQVSGEYSMVQAAAERGWLDGPRAMEETLTAIRRAGADRILTYFAKDFARRFRG
jgi:porphobilinogen synthase